MEPVLTLFDSERHPYADVVNFELDLAFGASENDFTLTLFDIRATPGDLIGIMGTEYGGVIDKVSSLRKGGIKKLTYLGRTWHGVLNSKIVCPPAGQDYVFVSGDANDVLASLLEHANLGGLIEVQAHASGIVVPRTQIERYATVYAAITKVLSTVGARLELTLVDDRLIAQAQRVVTFDDEIDSELIDFDVSRDACPVNHLIGLGSGELAQRAISHWYADKQGRVSQTQSLFGLQERAAIYDYNNANAQELSVKTKEKLEELQASSSASVEVHEGLSVGIGDKLAARENDLGLLVEAQVSKVVVRVLHGVMTVEHETGDTARSVVLTDFAENAWATKADVGALANAYLSR